MAQGDTPANPLPANTSKVEPKATWATIGAYVLGVVAVAVWGSVTDANLIEDLPDWATAILTPLVPAIGAIIAAYRAKHQWRSAGPAGQGTTIG